MTPDDPNDNLTARLRSELHRYQAPPRLRVSILDAASPRSRRPAWLAPMLSACATALVLILFATPLLPRLAPADPLQRMTRAVISEHSRALMWGARQPQILPAAQPWLTRESGIGLSRAFVGDDRLGFVGAEPVYIERERGVALHYRDIDGHLVSYLALPAAGLALPERQRTAAGRFRPVLVRDAGFATFVWKQGDVACFLVSDMVSVADLERFKDYFVRIRTATEPFPAY
ncbi:MAG: hypothetical protein WED01_11750 [Candidatus Rokuibacteriota bacterium]